jgi:hypothetical protein
MLSGPALLPIEAIQEGPKGPLYAKSLILALALIPLLQ